MLGSEGFIIHFDEDERNYYINEGYYGDSFTDALSVPDWDIKKNTSGVTFIYRSNN